MLHIHLKPETKFPESLKAIMPPTATDVTTAVCDPSVSVCVTLMQPATAVGWNEMPLGRDTRVVPSNRLTVSYTVAPVPTRKGKILSRILTGMAKSNWLIKCGNVA